MSLATRIALFFTQAIIIIGALISVATNILVSRNLSAQSVNWSDQVLSAMADALIENVSEKDRVGTYRIINDIVEDSDELNYAFIIDFDGDILAHTFQAGFPSDLLETVRQQSNTDLELAFSDQSLATQRSRAIIEGMSARIYVGLDRGRSLTMARNISIRIMLVSLALAILGAAVSVLLSRSIARPFTTIAERLGDFRQGKAPAHIDIDFSTKEEEQLSQVFNRFIDQQEVFTAERKESDDQIRQLINTTAEGIFGLSPDGVCTFANAPAARQLGYDSPDDLTGRFLHALIQPAYEDGTPYPSQKSLILRAMEAGAEIHRSDEVFWSAKGHFFHVEYDCVALKLGEPNSGCVVSFFDITNRLAESEKMRTLTAQLAHTSRISAINDLATGLAHEINQPLSAINSYAQAASRTLISNPEDRDTLHEDLEQISKQVMRAAEIIKVTRRAIRQDTPENEAFDINEVVREVATFMKAAINEARIELVFDFDGRLPEQNGNRVRFQQVIVNLVQNSIDALIESNTKHPTITIATRGKEGSVEIEVRDNGPGIPPERSGKIFDQFVTSKKSGTGLGLSIVRSILETLGGTIELNQEVDQGASFIIRMNDEIRKMHEYGP